MKRYSWIVSFWTVAGLGIALLTCAGNAEADRGWGHDHHSRGWGHDDHYWGWWGRDRYYYGYYEPEVVVVPSAAVSVFVDGVVYYYYRGEFYRQYPQGYAIVPAPVGVVVATLPAGFQTVVIGGVEYRCYNGVYYKPVPTGGYVVVPNYQVQVTPPAVPVPANLDSTTSQTLTVNITNKNGSYTPVKLQVASNGTYIGPRGEIYVTKPTDEQLKQMYGQ